MNPLFAAGLFDNPWIVAAIIIIGAFVNWLSQLRQQKKQREEEELSRQTGGETAPKPAEFDVEDALRRLLGEDESPKPTAAPPPIPRGPVPAAPAPTVRPPPVLVGRVPPPRPPVIEVAPAVETLSRVDVEAEARLAQIAQQVREHVAATATRRRAGRKWSGLWSDRASVRRAFVSSVVFGPPKGLES